PRTAAWLRPTVMAIGPTTRWLVGRAFSGISPERALSGTWIETGAAIYSTSFKAPDERLTWLYFAASSLPMPAFASARSHFAAAWSLAARVNTHGWLPLAGITAAIFAAF